MRYTRLGALGLALWILALIGCDEGSGRVGDGGGQDAGLDARPDGARGDAAPGDAAPGDAAPGDAAPGDAAPGDAAPGDAAPGDAAPTLDAAPGDAQVDAGPGDAGPGDATPGDAGPGDAGGDAAPAEQPTPILSEVVARNASGLEDEDGEASDWIELHNPGSAPYDLTDHHLTDDPEDPQKWRFPAIVIPPQGFLVVFASDKDRHNPPLHTGFALSGEGEEVALTDPQGRVLDTLAFPPQAQDIAFGRPMRAGRVSLVGSGDPARLYVGPPVPGMTEVGFDDSAWRPVIQGVGFDHRPPGGEPLAVRTDITEPLGLASTFWLRVPFEVPAGAGQVELALTYDDGIIAWVDGREVYRNNADPGTATDRPSSRALSPVRIPLGERVGPGVITLLVVNAAANDDVFFAEAAVVAPALEVDAQARYLPEPTPNAPNIVGPVDLGPIIFDLDRHQAVGAADPLVIGARVLPTQAPITTVTLVHRVMFAPEVRTPMVLDGERYVLTLPPGTAPPGHMVRWYVEAVDASGRMARHPPFADPSDSEEYFGTMISQPVDSNLPVYHWFVENPAAATTDAGARGALWFDGELYDNIRVDLHGQATRSFPKKSFNFDFTRDHRFLVDPALERVKDFDLLTNYADKAKMRNTLSYGMFRDAGHDHHLVFPVRVHQNGAFFAVYEHVEDPDERWLRRLGYTEPLGAVYKVYDNLSDPGRSEKKTREDEGFDDLAAFIAGISQAGDARRSFLYDHVDMARMANFLAMLFITSGMDCCYKNYYAQHNLHTDQWWYMPWDIDLTLGRNWTGNYFDDRMFPENPLYRGRGNLLIDALYALPEFDEMYLRRTRTLMDTLMQRNDTPYADRYLENEADRMLAHIGNDGVLDAAAWPPWGIPQTQAEAVRIMKEDWMIPRRQYLASLVQSGGPPARVLLDGRPGAAMAHHRVPVDDALGDAWTRPDFNDGAWALGPLGIGYEDGGADYAPFIRTTVRPREANPAATTVLVRVRFQVDAPLQQRLILRMRYDDGYVAWLNGVEVARRNVPAGPLGWQSTAAIHDDAAAVRFEDVDIQGFSDALVMGENVLAIRLVNTDANSSDLLLLPELVDGEVGGDGPIPAAQAANPDVIIEAVEPAPNAPREAYLVLHNRQGVAVDLSDGRLIGGGIAHTFPGGTVIPTDGRLYVVAHLPTFRQRAQGPSGGQGLFIQGNWQGALVPGGNVRLELGGE